MLTNKIPKSDLLAMLEGKSAQGRGAPTEGMIGGENVSEFAELLKTKSSLENLSPKDVLEFFKGKGELGGDRDLEAAFQDQLASPEAKSFLSELNFDGESFTDQSGKVLDAADIFDGIEAKQEGHLTQDLDLEMGAEIQKAPSKKVGQRSTQASPLDGILKPSQNKSVNTEAPATPSKNRASVENYDPRIQNPIKVPMNKKLVNRANLESGDQFIAAKQASAPKATQVAMPQVQRPVGLSTYHKSNSQLESNIIKVKSGNEIKPKVEVKTHSEVAEYVNNGGVETLDLQVGHSHRDSEGTNLQSQQKMQVVDLSSIQASNKAELINKVGSYIEQSYIAGQDNVEVVVNHSELGQFKVNAQRVAGNGVDIEISTMTQQGQQFFQENESELLRSLSKSGVKVSDLKIGSHQEVFGMSENGSKFSDSGDFSGQNKGEFSQQGQHGRQFSEQRNGQDRRQHMWQMAQDLRQESEGFNSQAMSA